MKAKKGISDEKERERIINLLHKAMLGGGLFGMYEQVERGDKKARKLLAAYSKSFFEKHAPKGSDNKQNEFFELFRKKFSQKLDRLMGEEADYFWIKAYLSYDVFLDDKTQSTRKFMKDWKYRYSDLRARYDKAIKVLEGLYKKKFIIYPYPFFITRTPPDYPCSLLRKKPLNWFIYGITSGLVKYTNLAESCRITRDFLKYWCGKIDVDLETIKKTFQRFRSYPVL